MQLRSSNCFAAVPFCVRISITVDAFLSYVSAYRLYPNASGSQVVRGANRLIAINTMMLQIR